MGKPQHEIEVQTLISSHKWKELAQLCEQIEFEGSNEPLNPNSGTFYGIHLWTYLILNDLNAARFLWKRMPTELKTELSPIWKIGQHVWKRAYQQIYTSLNTNWSPIFQPLAAAFIDSFRARTFALISTAYSSISSNDCAIILGYPPEETIKLVTAAGWRYDAASKLIEPVPQREIKLQKTGLEQLTSLTKYVVFLEIVEMMDGVKYKSKLNQALIVAAKQGDANLVHHYLNEGAYVDTVDEQNNNPLLWALLGGHTDCVTTLVDAGANVNIQCNGQTPLLVAIRYNQVQCLKVLLEKQDSADSIVQCNTEFENMFGKHSQ